jgi:hypothetical protein
MGMKLPGVTQQPLLFVDMTPDDELPIRILEAYLDNCYCLWRVEGLEGPAQRLYNQMNYDQGQRAVILSRAIQKLKAG